MANRLDYDDLLKEVDRIEKSYSTSSEYLPFIFKILVIIAKTLIYMGRD